MELSNVLFWLLPVIMAVCIALLRPDLRRQMAWAGLLAMPILLFAPIRFHVIGYPLGVVRLIALFCFGALAAALYEILLSKHFQTDKRFSRTWLGWLIVGPVVFLIGLLVFENSTLVLMGSLAIELIIVLSLRRDLIWDALFSSFAVAVLYLLLIIFSVRITGTPIPIDVLPSFSGVNLWGIPVEELITVAFFGALWGPLYPALKDLRMKQ